MQKAQVRAARALLGWSQEDLATRAGVSVATIRRQEPGTGRFIAGDEVLTKIALALESAGVELVASDSEKGHGVRLARASNRDALEFVILGVEAAGKSLQSAHAAATAAKEGELVKALDAALQSVAGAKHAADKAIRSWEEFVDWESGGT